MKLLNKSCCGCTLRSGTQVIAWAFMVLNSIQMLLNLYLALMYGHVSWWEICPGFPGGPPGGQPGPPGGGGRPPEVITQRPAIPPWSSDPDLEINFEDITPPTRFVGRRLPLAAKSQIVPYSVATEVQSMLSSPVPRGLYFALMSFNAIGVLLCFVLLVGIDMFDLGVMFVWLVAYSAVIIITIILYLVQLVGLYKYKIYVPAVFYTVGLFVGLALTIYFMAVVFSYFEELRKEE